MPEQPQFDAARHSSNHFRDLMSSQYLVYFAATVVSVVLSALLYWQDPLLNNDGVLYIQIARQFAEGSQQVKLFDMVFYPYCIGVLAKWATGGDVILAGQIFNSALHAITVIAFIRLTAVLGLARNLLWLPALIILSFEPMLEYRSDFIRDFGLWGFGLLALCELVCFSRKPHYASMLRWPLWLLLSFLFRYETIFIAFASVILLLDRKRPFSASFVRFAIFNSVLLAMIPVLGILFASGKLAGFTDLTAALMARALETGTDFSFSTYREAFAGILPQWSADSAGYMLVSGLLVVVGANLLHAMSPPVLLLAAFVCRRRYLPPSGPLAVWAASLAVTTFYLSAFTLSHVYLVKRYALFGSMLLVAIVAYQAAMFLRARGMIARTAVSALLLLGLADAFVTTGTSKQNLIDAIAWAKRELPANAKLSSNMPQLAVQPMKAFDELGWIRMRHTEEHGTILQEPARDYWTQSDYLLMRYEDGDANYRQALLSTGLLAPVQEFSRWEGDTVTVYAVRSNPQQPGR